MYVSPNVTSEVKRRIDVERRIVKSTVNELLTAGFMLSVYDGENESAKTTDTKVLLDALMNTDDDYLRVIRNGKYIGWIHFVYGNDGWDVMSDNTTNLDEYMPKTLALIEKLG